MRKIYSTTHSWRRFRLVVTLVFLAGGNVAFAQGDENEPVSGDRRFSTQTQEYRPSWSLIPEVRSPSFNYSEVQHGVLVARAAERLDYLSINNLIVGNTDGYQVRGPNGELFFLDNINAPGCGVQIIGQQIQAQDKTIVVNPSSPLPSSFIFIDNVDFSGCR